MSEGPQHILKIEWMKGKLEWAKEYMCKEWIGEGVDVNKWENVGEQGVGKKWQYAEE